MRKLMVVCAVLASGAAAQSSAAISGRVTDPDGGVLAGAFVQLKDAAQAATVFNTVSGDDGRYGFGDLAAGTYELSVNVPGMKGYKQAGIVLQAGQALRIDVGVEDGPTLRTLGEDPATLIAIFINRPDPPEGPAPRTADGKPDLSGMWLGGPAQLPELDLLPWAADLARQRTESNSKDYPPTYCLPAGPVPLLAPGFFKLVHAPNLLLMLFEGDTPGYRQVFLDGRGHPQDLDPTWTGHSTGRWEGDTLVIDSRGFNDKGWMDFEGRPYTEMLHVVQRIRRPDLGRLEIQVEVEDPGAYGKPWAVSKDASLAPDEEIREYICTENNRDIGHMVGK